MLGYIKKNKFRKKGFTYIETVFSVFIIGVGLVSLAQLMAKGTKLSIDGRNQVIGSQLAQEGVELVRNIRDNNRLHGQTSFEGLGIAFFETCIDVTYDTYGDPILANGCSDYRLYFDNANKEYIHPTIPGAEIPTPFYRKIMIDVVGNDRVVESIVWWDGGNTNPATCNAGKKCVSTRSVLTRWLE